jgi:hypothetical protein
MKAFLVAAVLLAGTTAASAEDYPPCSSTVTDKCMQHGGGHYATMKHHATKHHGKKHHGKMHKKHYAMHHKGKAKAEKKDDKAAAPKKAEKKADKK